MESKRAWGSRILWFVLLWVASVAAIALVGGLIKFALKA